MEMLAGKPKTQYICSTLASGFLYEASERRNPLDPNVTAVTDAHLYDSRMHHIPDPKLIELGGYAVIVTDYPEVVKRTYSAICSLGYLQGHPDLRGSFLGLIEYVDFRTYRGYLGPFRKSSEYAFQDEWRMALIDGREHVEAADHLVMDVGDLSDITMPVDASHLLKVGFRGEER